MGGVSGLLFGMRRWGMWARPDLVWSRGAREEMGHEAAGRVRQFGREDGSELEAMYARAVHCTLQNIMHYAQVIVNAHRQAKRPSFDKSVSCTCPSVQGFEGLALVRAQPSLCGGRWTSTIATYSEYSRCLASGATESRYYRLHHGTLDYALQSKNVNSGCGAKEYTVKSQKYKTVILPFFHARSSLIQPSTVAQAVSTPDRYTI